MNAKLSTLSIAILGRYFLQNACLGRCRERFGFDIDSVGGFDPLTSIANLLQLPSKCLATDANK